MSLKYTLGQINHNFIKLFRSAGISDLMSVLKHVHTSLDNYFVQTMTIQAISIHEIIKIRFLARLFHCSLNLIIRKII